MKAPLHPLNITFTHTHITHKHTHPHTHISKLFIHTNNNSLSHRKMRESETAGSVAARSCWNACVSFFFYFSSGGCSELQCIVDLEKICVCVCACNAMLSPQHISLTPHLPAAPARPVAAVGPCLIVLVGGRGSAIAFPLLFTGFDFSGKSEVGDERKKAAAPSGFARNAQGFRAQNSKK